MATTMDWPTMHLCAQQPQNPFSNMYKAFHWAAMAIIYPFKT